MAPRDSKVASNWSKSVLAEHRALLAHLLKKQKVPSPQKARDHLAEQCVAAWLEQAGLLEPTETVDDAVLDLPARLGDSRFGVEVKSDRNEMRDLWLHGRNAHDVGVCDLVSEILGPEYGVIIGWDRAPDPMRTGPPRAKVLADIRDELANAPPIPPGHHAEVHVRTEQDLCLRPLTLSVLVQRPPFHGVSQVKWDGDGWDFLLEQVLRHARQKDQKSASQGDKRDFYLAYQRFGWEVPRFDARQLAWAVEEGLFRHAPSRLKGVLLLQQRVEGEVVTTRCVGVERPDGGLMNAIPSHPPPSVAHSVTAGDAWNALVRTVDKHLDSPENLRNPKGMAELQRMLQDCSRPDSPMAPEVLETAILTFAQEAQVLNLFGYGEYMPKEWWPIPDPDSRWALPCVPSTRIPVPHHRPRRTLRTH